MYRVINGFFDLEDFKETQAGRSYHEYKPGDVYPREGVTPSSARIWLLSGRDNALGMPLIEPAWQGEAEPPARSVLPSEEPKPKRARKKKAEG